MYALFDESTYESAYALFGEAIGHCLRDNQKAQHKKTKLGRGVPPHLHQLVLIDRAKLLLPFKKSRQNMESNALLDLLFG
jgi:hypothetical protein